MRSADHRTKQGRAHAANRALEADAGRASRRTANSASLPSARPANRPHSPRPNPGRGPPTNCTKRSRTSRRRTTRRCARKLPIRWPTCSTVPATNGRPRFAPRKSRRKRTSPLDDEAGIHNAATLRSAAEIELAARDECRHAARRAARVVRQRRSAPRGGGRVFHRVTRCRCARNTPSTCAPCWP